MGSPGNLTDNEFVSFGMKKQAELHAVSLFRESACSSEYVIEISEDSQDWEEVNVTQRGLAMKLFSAAVVYFLLSVGRYSEEIP